MKLHTEEDPNSVGDKSVQRPFSCKVCEKSFLNKHHLKDHMMIHTGEKPFSCETCQKSFSRKHTLNEHMRLHTGEKPFSCDGCKKSFAKRGNLKLHMTSYCKATPSVKEESQ